eukprot:19996-Alexandrium_andersonii.AAC.1
MCIRDRYLRWPGCVTLGCTMYSRRTEINVAMMERRFRLQNNIAIDGLENSESDPEVLHDLSRNGPRPDVAPPSPPPSVNITIQINDGRRGRQRQPPPGAQPQLRPDSVRRPWWEVDSDYPARS